MTAARRTAGTILRQAGVEVLWLECAAAVDQHAAPAGECQTPIAWNEVVLRLVPAGTADPRRHHVSLGFSSVDLQTRGGTLATVYSDRIRALAQRAGTDPADLLGRAIAHEVGHLLLGTNQHSAGGLMRAIWSDTELRRNLPLDWLFSEAEAVAMRRGVAARAQAQPSLRALNQ
jgi:hypothetical protein